MKLAVKVGTFLSVLAMSSSALANNHYVKSDGYNDFYFGVGGYFLDIDADAKLYDANGDPLMSTKENISDVSMIGGLAGYRFNPWLSVEARGAFNSSDGDFLDESMEISKYFGVYARPTFPFHEHFSLYGLLGYGRATAELGGASDTESGFAYGLGMEIGNGNQVRLQVEWAVLQDETFSYSYAGGEKLSADFEINSINANLVWYFN
ncbi:porin family protein [Vibrio japonicus]|uniref:Porin family protein n=1 Tax=Vibrio japonicus TaxID=1824638 RepID=A0ABY5LEX7_9VIBR|nr:porin family protein [Vibrio japonicus]UUM29490.1 porin family protein [Vibrio japonicus]